MPHVKIITYKKSGAIDKIIENDISIKKAKKVSDFFKQITARKEDRMKKIFDEIPAINWEILKYANRHSKDEVLLNYPDHEKFINSIHFNDE